LNAIKDNFSKNLRMNRENQFTLSQSLQLKPEKLEKLDDSSSLSSKINYKVEEIRDCKNCELWNEKAFDLKSNLKNSIFKELKQFYINYSIDINKMSEKIEEVVFNYSHIEKQFNSESSGNKQKLKEYLSQIYKLISVLSVFIDKYSQDLYYYTQNMKKVFDFVGKTVYNQTFINSSIGSMPSKKSGVTNMNMNVNNINNKYEKNDKNSIVVDKKKSNYLESNILYNKSIL